MTNGREPGEVGVCLHRLRNPPAPVRLLRACVVGDGIIDLPDATPAVAAAAARVSYFIPASGAATRMFQALRAVPGNATLSQLEQRVANGETRFEPAIRALKNLPDLALYRSLRRAHPELPSHLGMHEPVAPVVKALRTSGMSALPKAIIPFHRDGDTERSPLYEHLIEAAAIAPAPCTRVHFTMSVEHDEACIRELRAVRKALQHVANTTFDVSLSHQHPSTDTPALTADGEMACNPDGSILFRPGGHGALLGNFPHGADLVLIKNIDNIVAAPHRAMVVRARRRLLQALLTLEAERNAHAAAVRSGVGLEQARRWLAALGIRGNSDKDSIISDLNRPLRTAGMVPNDGHPGGGPFWTIGPNGATPQIVEGGEIDHSHPQQKAVWRSATHFNPVDIACCLRGIDGESLDLGLFIDHARWFTSTKQHRGETLRVLERPGLWNGSMSGWLTRFVAMPREVFHPVKTVADLLAPAHQP